MKLNKQTHQYQDRAIIFARYLSLRFGYAVIALLLFAATGNKAVAQCCVTNSLIINTGWDPAAPGLLTPGTIGGTSVQDPKWTITTLSSDCQAYNPGQIPTYNAYVVPPITGFPFNWTTYPVCNWLSIDNQNLYATASGHVYQAVFTRQFYLCSPDDVVFDLWVAYDISMPYLSVDNVVQYSNTVVNVNNFMTFTHVVFTIPGMSVGLHTIDINVENEAAGSSSNAHGLDLHGSVTSATGINSIVSETGACTGYRCSSPGPISGPATVCVGATIALSDAIPGMTWLSNLPGIASVDPKTGVVTGVNPGTATITYGVPCDYQTYTVTVNPSPVFTPDYTPKPICPSTPWQLLWNGAPAVPGCTGCTYLWTGPSILSPFFVSTTPNPFMSIGSPAGVYTLTVTDNLGCSATQTLNVAAIPAPTVCVSHVRGSNTFVFSSSSTSATIYYQYVDLSGAPYCPGIYTVPGTGILSLATLSADCPGSRGVCVVGVCDGGCCWGRTPSTPFAPPLTACCAYFDAAGRAAPTAVIHPSENNGALTITPNPNNGTFHLSGVLSNTSSGNAKMEIVDILGKTVYSENLVVTDGSVNTDISLGNNIASGMYVIKVRKDDITTVVRLTLNR